MPLSTEDWEWFSSTTTSALSGAAAAADDAAAVGGGFAVEGAVGTAVGAGRTAPGVPVTGDVPGGGEVTAVSGAPQPATASVTAAATAARRGHRIRPTSCPQHPATSVHTHRATVTRCCHGVIRRSLQGQSVTVRIVLAAAACGGPPFQAEMATTSRVVWKTVQPGGR